MGANFLTMTVPGNLSREQVREEFEKAQAKDRYENGHSYSGGLGMASGLEFNDLTLPDKAAAVDWLDEHCDKWAEAQAVRQKTPDGGEVWLIGAVCAS